MWRDEVRAFSVATNARSWLELFYSLHQEGHPIVWYAVLRLGYALTHSTLVLPIAGLIVAWGAAFLMLRFAPFPFLIRLLAVLGAFLGYEMSVVSRNYGLGVLLMLSACVIFPARRDQPIVLGLVLAVLANTSAHAALAGLVLIGVWMFDLRDPLIRRTLLAPRSLAAVGIALGGVAFALWTSRPPPDMVYAFSFDQLQPDKLAPALFIDPGWGLRGGSLANIAAAGEISWTRFGLDPALVSRVIVDVSILSIAWSLRRNLACLVGLILAILGFEVLFRLVYPGSLRHQGILAFLLISLSWIASSELADAGKPRRRLWIALGLLPLLVTQAAALPFVVWRHLMHPESSAKSYAERIRATPRLRGAILAGEPDFLMETMPYYVKNRVFMPRQREFHYRVDFDTGARRKLELGLGDLIDIADGLAAKHCESVLLAIGHRRLASDAAGEATAGYGAFFRWDSSGRAQLSQRSRMLFSFTGATTDENYQVFEIEPPDRAACTGRKG